MKQRNYLLFIVDSLNYSHVKNSSIELMPFLKRLKTNAVYCENMYSQAPYTEAAVMNLYCGQNVLDNGGYLFRFKNAKTTIFEEMKKAGYETYYNSYQPQCHPSSVRRGVDHLYYNVGYDQDALWTYRLEHYSMLLKLGELSLDDYDVLYEIMTDNFREWIHFTDDMISHDVSVNMIYDNDPNYNPYEVKKSVLFEYDKYKANPKEYIDELLTTGKKHALFCIPAFSQKSKIKNREIVDWIKREYYPLFKRIRAINTRLNFKNCKGLIKGPIKKVGQIIRHPGMESYKSFLKGIYLSANELRDFDLFQRIDEDCDWFKNAPSARTHIDHYIDWRKNRETDKPHFACIHVDDIHNPEVFFTYDSEDKEVLLNDKREAINVLKMIPKDYYGCITHDLSLRYIDNIIKYLYQKLESEKMLDDLCICICADHGFSFSGNPLRDSFVINLYLENYNIPCLFTGTGFEKRQIDEIRTSKDIPASICKLATGHLPTGFTGHSIFENYKYDNVRIEYCGGGCPDLRRRELKIAAFDDHYFVGTLCTLGERMKGNKITEIYNLQSDPEQKNNLRYKTHDRDRVEHLLKAISERRKQIDS